MIFALSGNDLARRRMALMRDVTPVPFEYRGISAREAARFAVKQLFDDNKLAIGDHVVVTNGDEMDRRGGTNTLRLLQVGVDGRAVGLADL
jgi:pyruvate kinase